MRQSRGRGRPSPHLRRSPGFPLAPVVGPRPRLPSHLLGPRLLFVGLLLTGCARVDVVEKEVYQQKGVQVTLRENLKAGKRLSLGLEHPWEVTAEEMDAILGSILYAHGNVFLGKKQHEAFPLPERQELLLPLREAFSRATPDQMVGFAFSESRRHLKVFERNFSTEGVLFRTDGKLHCAFRALARKQLPPPVDMPGQVQGNPARPSLQDYWVLVPRQGQELFRGKSTVIPDPDDYANWIVLDLARNWGARETGPGDAAAPGATDREQAKEPLLTPVESAPVSPQPTSPEVERQLRLLDELHREGDLTDEAYQRKRNQLLE